MVTITCNDTVVYGRKIGDTSFEILAPSTNFIKRIFNITENKVVGKFQLHCFPNCRGIAVLTSVEINEKYRGKGYSKLLLQYAEHQANYLGYTCIMATVNNLTPSMHKALLNANYKVMNEFINLRSSNTITIYNKNIRND